MSAARPGGRRCHRRLGGDALTKEANKLRPAIVVDDGLLFDPDWLRVLVVPLTEDTDLAFRGLSLAIDPSPENGFTKRCFALAPLVTAASGKRMRRIRSRVTDQQLRRVRLQIAKAAGAI